MRMDYVYYIYNNVKYFYNSMNPANLTGAIDVIVVEQPDGSLLSTPFHVRFGKYGVFNYHEKYVDIEVNGEKIDLIMKLGDNGVAFFVENTDEGESPSSEAKNADGEEEREEASPETLRNSLRNQIERRNSNASYDDITNIAAADASSSSSPAKKALPSSMPTKHSKMAQRQSQHKHKDSLHDQQRQRLPFSFSIYSCRRNRSLPDLTHLLPTNTEKQQNKRHSRSAKEEADGKKSKTAALRKLKKKASRLKHSCSVSVPLKNCHESPTDEPTQESDDGSQRPINSADSSPTRQKEEDDTCVGMKSIPSTSDIANEALSDSEVDRQRSNPHINDPEWKWGEIPKEKTVSKSGENEAMNKSRWNYWFGRWSRRHKKEGGEVETGILLQDIGSDQKKMEVYIGSNRNESMCISSKSSDSGNVTSLGVSPLATRCLSEENLSSTGDFHHSGSSFELELIEKSTANYKRSLRLSSDQLRLLNLYYGSNDARFSITTKYQGTAWCSCHIFLLKWCDKLVVSDIDGTITKSDVLGHVIPAIGGTWAHSGVAELYTRIKQNGYQMVYLSSRAIGQSHYTKTYLQNFAQGSRTLPDGPVLLSPSSVLMAFRKEVIEKKPEEFKIACLSDVKSLFPDKQPYFAGFGNRETDVKSYRAVEIPLERIMIIDHQGRLRRADNKMGYMSDYLTIAMNSVDYVFPPRAKDEENNFNEFIVWRANPQQFDDLVDAELEAYEERKRKARAVTAIEEVKSKNSRCSSKRKKANTLKK